MYNEHNIPLCNVIVVMLRRQVCLVFEVWFLIYQNTFLLVETTPDNRKHVDTALHLSLHDDILFPALFLHLASSDPSLHW